MILRALLKGGATGVALVSCAFAAPAIAQDTEKAAATAPADADAIVVFGRGEAKISVAHAASEGTVAGADLLVRPLLRVAELIEVVPGLVAAQHSGSGKANQYFLRGVNLDHGSDFAAAIDDVQMNLRSHGHGQGYLDLNGLIPEIVAREDYRKGPYRADGGDFALAGAAAMTTIDGFDRPWVSAEGGSRGYGRIAAGGTIGSVRPGKLTLVAQAKVYDGPWQQPERLRHGAAFAKFLAPAGPGRIEASLHAYRATWRPTEQVPERIIGGAVCADVFCSPDPSARGATTRLIANVAMHRPEWRANLYGQFYDWAMSSNPTFADPDGTSAQIRQFDRRWIVGARAEKRWTPAPALTFSIGTDQRYDHIGSVGVERTHGGGSLGRYHVEETSAALYGEATWRPVVGLRLIGGVRGDYYGYAVRAKDAAAAAAGTGSGNDAIVSPKASIAYAPAPWLELYGNWGRGFHSNDVRGAANVQTPVPVLVRGEGRELGARVQFRGVTLTGTYWWLGVDSELRFVGDSNAVEPSGASSRRGYELVGFWRPLPWLAIDGSYTASHSRYDNGDRIPNAFENAASAGIALVLRRWEASLRLRHLGPYPLIEDDSVRSVGSTVINLRASRKLGRFELYGELLNLLDSRDKDIAYYYESYIPGFDTAGPVKGRLSRVVEPRTMRWGVRMSL